ncbi:MAG TPA: HAD family hydrolase [Fibrobacteria bacterium]|nr:HAD family hydrolase [Fibrobacteria bacterium]
MLKAITFDLGDTLLYYEGVPLNWSLHYHPGLTRGFEAADISMTESMLDLGAQVLTKYNTRLHPREVEYSAERIFSEICESIAVDPTWQEAISNGFFSYFQQKAILYPDTIAALTVLKERGCRIGILTDVAYGMPKAFVERDISPFRDWVDVLLTSVDVGCRKPSPCGFRKLSEALGTPPDQMVYVGNEEKDILGANYAGFQASVLIHRGGEPTNYGQTLAFPDLEQMTAYFLR